MLRKIFATIIVIALMGICVFQMTTNSTTFKIDADNLKFKNDYPTNYDVFPQQITNNMIMSKTGFPGSIDLNLSGQYVKEKMPFQVKELLKDTAAENYIWLNASYEIALCFIEDNLYIISTDSYTLIQTFNFVYNDGKIEIYDKMGGCDFYACELKYSSQSITLSSNNTAANVKDNFDGGTQETQVPSEETDSKINHFINNVILPWIWGIMTAGFFSVLIIILVFRRMSFLMQRKYKKSLKSNLFPQEHLWFGNNHPTEIYISAKVIVENKHYEYDLLKYFSSAIMGKSSNYIILGKAGEGKTFSVSRLILDILECFSINKSQKKERKKVKGLIPILLNFSELINCKKGEDIIDSIYEQISKTVKFKKNIIDKILYYHHKTKIIRTIEHYLSMGNFVIFIDGYDEIENTEKRLNISKIITDFMNDYDKCNFILTSRTQIYEEEKFVNIPPENTLYLAPFTEEQIHKFVSKWSFPEGKSCSDLFRRIINTRQLSETASNPLLLTMITSTYSNSEVLDFNSKTQLYQKCCNCLLAEWEKEKKSIKRIKRYDTVKNLNIKLKLLSEFAFKLYILGQPSLQEEKLLELWNSQPFEKGYFHGKAKNVLDDIINESGILEHINGNIRFHHKSFYEYFIALYLSQNNCDTEKLYDNVLINSNILFFYFSMVPDERIVTDFISINIEYHDLICDVLLERNISDASIVRQATQAVLDNISYLDISDIQTIGYIAKRYPVVASKIKETLLGHLFATLDETERINIIIGLMIFCDKTSLSSIFDAFSSTLNAEYLVKYLGESINDFSYTIISLLKNTEKVVFIENLAKSFRFEAIYNIYIKGKAENEIRDLAIIGLLYMTKDPDLLNLLATKKFADSINLEEKKQVKHIKEKYGWENNELSEVALANLFTLVYLSGTVVQKGFHFNAKLIENKISFLLCLFISDAKSDLYYKLLEIDNLSIKSTLELNYHWNLIKKRKMKTSFYLRQGIIDTLTINRVIFTLFGLLISVQMIIIATYCNNVNELSYSGWLYNDIHIHSVIPFNCLYLITMVFIFLSCEFFNWILKKTEYNLLTITFSILFSLAMFLVYSFLVKDITFRILTLIFLVIISALEIIKHKNNYPSFKDPQYSRISSFLNTPYHFNDIIIG